MWFHFLEHCKTQNMVISIMGIYYKKICQKSIDQINY